MTKRQGAILSAVIKEYIDTAQPVGSRVLAQKYGFKLSPATIRNEMMALAKDRYLTSPHTSAGRIPTNKGYRYFVNSIVRYSKLARAEQERVERELQKIKKNLDVMWKSAADVLSQMTESVAVTSREPDEAFTSGIAKLLKQPEFSSIERACEMAEIFEHFAERINDVRPDGKAKEVQVYIGNEHSLTREVDCSLVVSDFELPSGGRGRVAVLGPTRMKYGKNISLVSFLSKLLGGVSVVLLVVMI